MHASAGAKAAGAPKAPPSPGASTLAAGREGGECRGGAPTHLLGHWVREKEVLSLEEGVRQLTSSTADCIGLTDRGRLKEGLAADIVVFDPETVGCEPLRRVHDLPAGADRLVADATGIHSVIVNGTPIREHAKDLVDPDGALPGQVLRGGAATSRA